MSTGIPISLDNLELAKQTLGATTPIAMLHLLRFRPQAQYPPNTITSTESSNPEPHSTTTPLTGLEVYLKRYIPAITAAATQITSDVTPLYLGSPVCNVITGVDDGSSERAEQWDFVGLIAYPNIDIFRQVVESDFYKREAEPHRLASLAGWRLMAVRQEV